MSDHLAVERYSPHFERSLPKVIADLESYANLLGKWQTVQNLVSRETLSSLWTRHFADSLQVLPLLTERDQLFVDLGSGGGFPALPLAIATKGSGRRFVLVEPNARKVSFLRTVSREIGLDVVVIGQRSDEIDSRETGVPDVITSRALAELPQLCAWMDPFFGPDTRAILHKGREHVEELIQADAHWLQDVLIHPSDTDASGVILTIRNLRRKSVS